MKKNLFISIILVLLVLLVSCSSFDSSPKKSLLRNMGKDGDIIVTGKSKFISPEYSSKFDRVNISYSEGQIINGCVEGRFSKFLGSIAVKYIDLGSLVLDYYQPSRGKMFFSTINAKEYEKSIREESAYIDEIDYDRMINADFAVYSKHPASAYQNLEKFVALVFDDLCNVEITATDSNKAKGLFTAIKASYISYLTKNKMTIDYRQLTENFVLSNDSIYINNLKYDGFIKSFVEEILYYGN